jgi:hypothetical protein
MKVADPLDIAEPRMISDPLLSGSIERPPARRSRRREAVQPPDITVGQRPPDFACSVGDMR